LARLDSGIGSSLCVVSNSPCPANSEYVTPSRQGKDIRLTGWKERVWSRRHQIVISDEEEAQVERLLYILDNCVEIS